MTIKQLKAALKLLGKGHDNKQVVIWLPGSKIDLGSSFMRADNDTVMIEGNVRAGSVLDQQLRTIRNL